MNTTRITALLFAAVFAATLSAQNPFTDSGSYATTTDKIAIGSTTQPTRQLEVTSGNGDGVYMYAPSTPTLYFFASSGTSANRNWGIATNYNASGDFAILRSSTSSSSPYGGTVAMTILTSGYTGIGTSTPAKLLHVAGDIQVDGNINAKFQDVAEWVPTTTPGMTAGTVVVVDAERNNEVIRSAQAYDTAVAGVVSDRPGLLLGEADAAKTKIATTGRVRVCVDARRNAVKPGDLLVTSDVPGCAMRSEPLSVNGRSFHQPGTLIGKALEPLSGKVGEVLVLLSLQ